MDGGTDMQISMIADESGAEKTLMSKFPMKGVKPNWFMVASGNSVSVELRVLIYN